MKPEPQPTERNMKRVMPFLLVLLFQSAVTLGQIVTSEAVKEAKKVSFETLIDITQSTKDGIYLNGYVVNIPYTELTKLNGKKVRIRGKVTIVKGVDYTGGEATQGRQEDTRHILKPRIHVIKD